MDERVRFVGDVLKGERSMSEVCGLYGISRKTGYKWLGRYEAAGASGLQERSHAPDHLSRADVVLANVVYYLLQLVELRRIRREKSRGIIVAMAGPDPFPATFAPGQVGHMESDLWCA